jgi:hypothetical protein
MSVPFAWIAIDSTGRSQRSSSATSLIDIPCYTRSVPALKLLNGLRGVTLGHFGVDSPRLTVL